MFLNFIGFSLLIASIFIFGLKEMPTEMGIAVAASCIFLAFANLEKFSEFKGAGFQAKLKEAVEEANATIENLKEVAKPLIKTNLCVLAESGRFSAGAFDKNHDVYNQLIELQTKFGLNDAELVKFSNRYLNINAWDMIDELSENIERSGVKSFSVTSRKEIGINSFDVAPNLHKFKELLKDVELDENSKIKFAKLQKYYKNNKL
jgi:hypothetical protein